MKKNIKVIIVLLLIIIYVIIGNKLHIYIPCIFRKVTGLLCPGCGSTRMIREILQGNFIKAFHYNQFLFLSLPIFIILFIDYMYSNIKNKKSLINKIPNYVYYMYIVLLLVFGVIRNII